MRSTVISREIVEEIFGTQHQAGALTRGGMFEENFSPQHCGPGPGQSFRAPVMFIEHQDLPGLREALQTGVTVEVLFPGGNFGQGGEMAVNSLGPGPRRS